MHNQDSATSEKSPEGSLGVATASSVLFYVDYGLKLAIGLPSPFKEPNLCFVSMAPLNFLSIFTSFVAHFDCRQTSRRARQRCLSQGFSICMCWAWCLAPVETTTLWARLNESRQRASVGLSAWGGALRGYTQVCSRVFPGEALKRRPSLDLEPGECSCSVLYFA